MQNSDKPERMPNVPPFVQFVCANVPMVFDDSLSYYEALCALWKYVQGMTDVINNNATLEEEYIEKFDLLEKFVNEYFDNLDVQEEINNKLDEMVEDGTLEDIMSRLVDTKLDYYLVDNTWDQSDIQALFDSTRAKIIEFKDGTYDFTSTFRLNSNTKIILNNAVINSGHRHLFYNFKDSDTSVTGYNGNHNIQIIGGKINGDISFIHGKNILLKDISFYHVENDHCMEICACKNVIVDGCTFEGVKTQTEDRQYVENVQIENATHTAFPWLADETATYDNTGCENVTVQNCEFKQTDIITYQFYTAIGGHTHVDDYPHYNVVIKNNKITNSISNAIRFQNVTRICIEGNIISDTTYANSNGGIQLQDGCDNVIIKDNTITGFTSSQIYIANGTDGAIITNNIFKDMTTQIDDTEPNVIICRQVNDLKINNNTFSGNIGGIVYQLAQNNGVQSNCIEFIGNVITNVPTVTDIYYYRLRIYNAKKIVFADNIFNENQTDGYLLRLHEDVTQAIVKNNIRSTNLNKIVIANGYVGSYADVYDVMFDAYSGNTTTITNQSMAYDYAQFNKAILIYGDGAQCNVREVRAFSPMTKLDARTTLMAVCTTASDTPEKSAITFNSDAGHTISLTSPTLKIRHIYFMNE